MMAALKIKALIPNDAEETGKLIAKSYDSLATLQVCSELLLSKNGVTSETQGNIAVLLQMAIECQEKIHAFLENLELNQTREHHQREAA